MGASRFYERLTRIVAVKGSRLMLSQLAVRHQVVQFETEIEDLGHLSENLDSLVQPDINEGLRVFL